MYIGNFFIDYYSNKKQYAVNCYLMYEGHNAIQLQATYKKIVSAFADKHGLQIVDADFSSFFNWAQEYSLEKGGN